MEKIQDQDTDILILLIIVTKVYFSFNADAYHMRTAKHIAFQSIVNLIAYANISDWHIH